MNLAVYLSNKFKSSGRFGR